jgi:arylsulfatase A-like enzyme
MPLVVDGGLIGAAEGPSVGKTLLVSLARMPACTACFLALMTSLAGCAADRPIHVRIDNGIRLPDRAAVIFFIDGLGLDQFEEALTENLVPNMARHILHRGVRVQTAVACIPTITYANAVTFLTGRVPGHHGVVASKWFEPSTGRYQNYCFAGTYQDVDQDYSSSPTIYELLSSRVSVNVQLAIRRGATHSIDNWALSGINWFFENQRGVDCLVAQQFELVAERTRWWGRWPDLIMAYFPGADHMAHQYGPASPEYKKTIANIDKQIGRICGALQDIGVYDRTYLCLVSDHGFAPVKPQQVFDIAAVLAEETKGRTWVGDPAAPEQGRRILKEYDYAVAVGGSRWAAVYPLPLVLQAVDSPMRQFADSLERLETTPSTDGLQDVSAEPQVPAPPWLTQAVAHPGVELIACCFRPGRVHILTQNGQALIERTAQRPFRHRVHRVTGARLFESEAVAPSDGAEVDDGRAWLRATANDPYPDFVPQIVASFDHERAGNIVLFAAEGWDFSHNDPYGGHGSILRREMQVPMLFAGPGLRPGGVIPCARNCDLMPTLLHMLTGESRPLDGTRVDIDGVDLIPSTNFGDG